MNLFHMRSRWQPTKLERRVQGIAERRATKQLMRIPWNRFQKGYDEYPRWEALALWVRAIVDSNGAAPRLVVTTLREQCPSFLDERRGSGPSSLGFSLQEWIHERVFGTARQEGWLDALVFYGVRSLRSQSTWAYWERCEEKWDRKPPSSYPGFKEWLRLAQNYGSERGLSLAAMTADVEKYVEWTTFSRWLEPFVNIDNPLPEQVAAELEQRCPGFLDQSNSQITTRGHARKQAGRKFITWIEERLFAEAKLQGRLGTIREQAEMHPLCARIARYSKVFNKGCRENLPLGYLPFAQWRSRAENHIEN